MKEKTTFYDLMLFAFNETQLSDTVKVTTALEENEHVKNAYEEIQDVLSSVSSAGVEPSQTSVKRILKYALSK